MSVKESLLECTSFVENVLQPRLQELVDRKDLMIQDIAGYQKLNEWIEENCNQIGDVVDKVFWSHIGGNCHVQTKMKFNPVSDSIYVDVGLGFRLPLSFQDAKVVSLERIKLLGGKLVLLQRDIDSVVADIEQTLSIIQQFSEQENS